MLSRTTQNFTCGVIRSFYFVGSFFNFWGFGLRRILNILGTNTNTLSRGVYYCKEKFWRTLIRGVYLNHANINVLHLAVWSWMAWALAQDRSSGRRMFGDRVQKDVFEWRLLYHFFSLYWHVDLPPWHGFHVHPGQFYFSVGTGSALISLQFSLQFLYRFVIVIYCDAFPVQVLERAFRITHTSTRKNAKQIVKR